MGRHVVDGREWPQPKKIGASRRPDLPPRGENYPHKPAMTSNSVKSQMRGVDMAAEWPGEPGHRGFLSMADVAGVATVKRCQIQTHDGHNTTPHCGAGEWHAPHPHDQVRRARPSAPPNLASAFSCCFSCSSVRAWAFIPGSSPGFFPQGPPACSRARMYTVFSVGLKCGAARSRSFDSGTVMTRFPSASAAIESVL